MVAGSGPDPGTDKTKRLYDGKLDSWPAAKIKLKSFLFKLGLWNVVQDGPSDHAETPVHAHAGPLPGEPEGEYFYSLRDTDINGPCSGKTIQAPTEWLLPSAVLDGKREGSDCFFPILVNASPAGGRW